MKINLRAVCSLLLVPVAAVSTWGYIFIPDNRPGDGALPIKWPAGTVPIVIKLGTNTSGTLNYDAAVQAAAQDWNANIGNLQITSTIAAPSPAAQSNGANEIVFADRAFDTTFDSRTLAITTTWSIGNERTQADIIFNTAYQPWGIYDGPLSGSTDLRRVALHELGHLLGLDHPDQATPPQSVLAVMNSQISNTDRITADDIVGVQQLYGQRSPNGVVVPNNDNFANATALTLNGNNAATATGNSANATRQTGEPNHVGTNTAAHSVWWRWTAPTAGSMKVDTRGSYFDTVLAVYTGTAVNSLNSLGGNDDISEDPHIQASNVTFTAISGQTYYFAVDGWDGDAAGVTLNLTFTPSATPPPTITSQPVSTSVTVGGTASFSVTASNANSYQWSFNNSPISGATSSSYAITNAQNANAGSYFVTATNDGGSVASNTVTLTVTSPPSPPVTPPSSGGGGGGGAPSLWFYGVLSLLGLARFLRRRALGAQI